MQDAIKNETVVQMVSFSVMPCADMVAALKHYVAKNDNINHKWHLLIGIKE